MADFGWLLGGAVVAIAAGLVFAQIRSRMLPPRKCGFCGGVDGKHTRDCDIVRHRRPDASGGGWAS